MSAGIEFLNRGTYTLDPVHPTLARIAIGLPLLFSGERYPHLSDSDPGLNDYNVVGNHILYDSGHFAHNLLLARLGVLPFFVLGVWIVYRWATHASGKLAAVVAVFLFCTAPAVLAFSSIAYTDIVAASTQLAAMFCFALWLEAPSWKRTVWLAFGLGLAFLTKFTSLLYLPSACLFMASVWMWKRHRNEPANWGTRSQQLFVAVMLALLIVWGGYRFSVHHLHEATGITASNLPSFQHLPEPLRSPARRLLLYDPVIPAPELLNGLASAWFLNKNGTQSYLLEHTKTGGWWYFFLVALGVKTPLPLIILFGIGLVALLARLELISAMPLASLFAVLLITMRVSYQVGTRHVLVAMPLMSIIAGAGVAVLGERLYRSSSSASAHSIRNWRFASLVALLTLLLLWQGSESLRSQSDFLSYFNQLAGKDPSAVLVMGCDLDCGEDLYRLAAELRQQHVDHVTLAIWSSADISHYGLPAYEIADPSKPLHGWIALSARASRTGDVLHQSVPTAYLARLNSEKPVGYVGRTIRLYHLPKLSTMHDSRAIR
ncbi:MAG TPA: glycosyltransferase family 39 protein [Terriglobales bacterium]|nr:glycosyltransferase family 39 protein [Terriglobales bacterium]